MTDDALFDPHRPDDELDRLEAALAPLRHQPRELPDLGPQDVAVPTPPAPADTPPRRLDARPGSALQLLPWALAAGLLLMVWQLVADEPGAVPLDVTAGEGLVGARKLERGQRLTPGDRLRVAGGLTLRVGDLGSLRLGPDSRLAVLPAEGAARCRLALDRGRMEALIHAVPELFQVTTPAGLAVDRGCAYTAEVGPDGVTTLEVTEGLVTFSGEGRTVWVPAGARLRARPGQRPDSPLWVDAPGQLFKAFDLLDRLAERPEPATLEGSARQALDWVLAVDAPRDGLLLWHLLDHPWRAVRDEAARALAVLIPPPDLVPADDPAAADARARRAWLARVQYAW